MQWAKPDMRLASIAISFQLGSRNVFRNPRRSVLTLLAITMGVWSSIALSAWARGIANQMADEAILNFTGHLQVQSPGFSDDPVLEHSFQWPNEDLLQHVNDPIVSSWTVRLRVPAVIRSEREAVGVTLLGVVPKQERGVSFLPDAITEGNYLTDLDDAGLLVGNKLLDLLQTKLQRRVVVMSEGIDHVIADQGFRITGVYSAELESTEKSYVITGLNTAQKMLRASNQISELAIILKNRREVDDYVQVLGKIVPSLRVTSWQNLEPLIGSMMKMQGGFLILWFGIVVLTVSFGLINTLFMSIFERTHELSLMQALGLQPQYVLIQIMLESFLLIITGIMAGGILGAGTVYYFSNGINMSAFSSATEFIGVPQIIVPRIQIEDVITLVVMIFVLGLLGTLYPAWKASSTEAVHGLGRHH